jgi:hypothetical protein
MNAQQILDGIYGTQTQDPIAQQLAGVLAQYTQQFQSAFNNCNIDVVID